MEPERAEVRENSSLTPPAFVESAPEEQGIDSGILVEIIDQRGNRATGYAYPGIVPVVVGTRRSRVRMGAGDIVTAEPGYPVVDQA